MKFKTVGPIHAYVIPRALHSYLRQQQHRLVLLRNQWAYFLLAHRVSVRDDNAAQTLLTIVSKWLVADSCSEWMTVDPTERDFNRVTSVLPYDVHSLNALGQNSTVVYYTQTIDNWYCSLPSIITTGPPTHSVEEPD